MAGLTAARTLTEAGKSVVVLEARTRVGGRIHTEMVNGEPVELGAEFVHGRPPELLRLLQQASLLTWELDGEELCFEGGKLADCGRGHEEDLYWIKALKQWRTADCSFAEYLQRGMVPEESKERLIGFVEGFNAADHRQIGVAALGKQQAAEDAIEGDRLFRVRGGYSRLTEFLHRKILAAKGILVMDTQATAIRWRRGQVDVDCVSQGKRRSFRAAKVIVTLPLGLLQADAVAMTPRPASILEAAGQMRMGSVMRATLVFRRRIWAGLRLEGDGESLSRKLEQLSFLYVPGAQPAVWWTSYPHLEPTLTAWSGGPSSNDIAALSPVALTHRLVESVARLFSLEPDFVRSELVQCVTHDWQRDPFALGSYSYAAVGGSEASEQMCLPVENTLFFAGEHTDTSGHWGTVHGAMRSGLRAAAQAMQVAAGANA